MKKTARSLAALALSLAVVGCHGLVPRPTEADVPYAQKIDPAADLAGLKTGRSRYVARCASCHRLSAPDDAPEGGWGKVLDTMAPKAKLSSEDRRLVEVYLRTIASEPPEMGNARKE